MGSYFRRYNTCYFRWSVRRTCKRDSFRNHKLINKHSTESRDFGFRRDSEGPEHCQRRSSRHPARSSPVLLLQQHEASSAERWDIATDWTTVITWCLRFWVVNAAMATHHIFLSMIDAAKHMTRCWEGRCLLFIWSMLLGSPLSAYLLLLLGCMHSSIGGTIWNWLRCVKVHLFTHPTAIWPA